MRLLSLWIIVFCSVSSSGLHAQQPEWLFKNHKYHRLKTGSSFISVDNTRSTLLFDGGPYDTYATSDGGKSWRTIFDTKMFFIDVASNWTIDRSGRWYYNGRLYLKLPVNLVSDDAGATLRFLVRDTAELGFYGRWEVDPYHIPPNSVAFDMTTRDEPHRGVYLSCDGGISPWVKSPGPSRGNTLYASSMHMKPIRAGVFGLADSLWNTVEVDACTGIKTATTIDARSRWVQLSNGTIIRLTLQKNAIGIRRPGSTEFTYDTVATVTGDTTRYRIATTYLDLVNDTMAVIFGRKGEVWTVGLDATLRPVFVPKQYSTFQTITGAGAFGDLFITKTYVPEGNLPEGTIYTVINVKTGKVSIHRRPVAKEQLGFINTFDKYQLVPYSDSVWFAGYYSGELLTTTNAGQTWRLVSNIVPDPQWGSRSIGIDRLYPRGDGTMALLTEHGRVMTQDKESKAWDIVIPGPFQHKIRMPENYTSGLTYTRWTFAEDFNGLYRNRYGPSQLYFPHPDTVWVTGDVVTRYLANGAFIDTVLPRRSRFIKRLSDEVTVCAMDSMYFSFNNGREWVYVGKSMPVVMRDTIATTASLGDIIMANNGTIVAGLRGMRIYDDEYSVSLRDTIPGGVVSSTDGGNTWKRVTSSIDTSLYVSSLHKTSKGTLLCLASELRIDPWYLDSFTGEIMRYKDFPEKCYQLDQSFIYRSTDDGATWTRTFIFPDRGLLPKTDIRFIDMPDGRTMALHPTFGVAITADDGVRWSVGDPLNIGNPEINDVAFTSDGYAHFATSDGYARLKVEDIVSVRQIEAGDAESDLRVHVTADGLVQASSMRTISSLAIYTTDGRQLDAVRGQATNLAVDISQAPRGVYLAVAMVDGTPVTRTVIR
ncbi:MAG: WD40/YVTN/BNR-like repeat-containing protein [Ignavibacteria bacterium]